MNPLMIAQLAGTVYQVASGINQRRQAKKLGEQFPRPTYQIPEAQLQATNLAAQQAAQTRIPGYENMMQNMREQQASALYGMRQAAANPAQIVQNVGRMTNKANRFIRDVSIEGAKQQQANMRAYQAQLNALAQAQNQQFDINQQQPYLQAQQSAANLRDASNYNIYNALNTGAQTGYMIDQLSTGMPRTDWQGIFAPKQQVPATQPNGNPFMVQQEPGNTAEGVINMFRGSYP